MDSLNSWVSFEEQQKQKKIWLAVELLPTNNSNGQQELFPLFFFILLFISAQMRCVGNVNKKMMIKSVIIQMS